MTGSSKQSFAVPGRARRSRSFLVLALLLVGSLVVSSCAQSGAWIARVDGTVIDSPNFWEGVGHYATLNTEGESPIDVDTGVGPVSDAALWAFFLLQLHAIDVLNARHGIEVTEADIQEQREIMEAAAAPGTFEDVPDWFMDQLARGQASYEALMAFHAEEVDNEALIDELVEQYYEQNLVQFQQVCLGVIAGDEAELVEARQRLDEGTDFASVAQAVAAGQPADAEGQPAQAIGDNADGDAGCIPTATAMNMFADPSMVTLLTEAEPDELVGPVPVAGGIFMLFEVRSVETQPLAEVRPMIEAAPEIAQAVATPGRQAASEELNEFVLGADIDLNPRIGSWENGVGYSAPTGAELAPGQTTVPVVVSGASG